MLGHSSAKETLDTYSDLFDTDLDTVAVAGVAARRSIKQAADHRFSKSPVSDSNRRPPLYKSGALAN
jgi:hypothetical protein